MTSATQAQPKIPVLDLPDESHLPQEHQDFLFAVRGCRILKQVLTPTQVAAINAWVDEKPLDTLKTGDWVGDCEIQSYGAKDGLNFQNILEGGPIFEELIDNPKWIDLVRRYIQTTHHHLAIDEAFLNVRRSGGYIPIHSGGTIGRFTRIFEYNEGHWFVGQINILMALTDISYGDGATTIIPGSHRSPMSAPTERAWQDGKSGHDFPGMFEVHLKAGDALMFTDAVCHGSCPRTNPGERRVLIYRYAPHLLANRFHYLPSEELLARLTPERRRIVQPLPPRGRPGRTLTFQNPKHREAY